MQQELLEIVKQLEGINKSLSGINKNFARVIECEMKAIYDCKGREVGQELGYHRIRVETF